MLALALVGYGKIIDLYHPRSQELFDYWQSLPKEGVLPLRSSFFPEQIPLLLPNLIIYEMVSKDFINFRLAGTGVRERVGFDPTGHNYLDFVTDDRREKAAESFFSIVGKPCGMRVVSNHGMSTGRKMFLEVLVLPLKNDMSEHPIVLCQSTEIKPDATGHAPDDARLENISIIRRDFIDLGAGVSDFKD